MRSFGHHNVIKHKETNNSEQYIALDIYLQLYFLDKREVTSSGPRNYVATSGRGVNMSLDLRTSRR